MTLEAFERIDWAKGDGLVPAIVQDARTREVLMLGYVNREALLATLETRRVTFFSRSKQRLWTKGESSGNFLNFVDATVDCDCDAVRIRATPDGPTCHRGTYSCFGEKPAAGVEFLGELQTLIESRYRERPAKSYTTQLFADGVDRMAQKVGEEAVETVIAAKNPADDKLLGESADLIFHLMVLLTARGLSLADVAATLEQRHRPR